MSEQFCLVLLKKEKRLQLLSYLAAKGTPANCTQKYVGGPKSNMSCWDWGRDCTSCGFFDLCPNLGRFLLRINSFFKSQYLKPCNEFKRLSILIQNPAGTLSAHHICSQFFAHYCAREQDVQQVHQKLT